MGLIQFFPIDNVHFQTTISDTFSKPINQYNTITMKQLTLSLVRMIPLPDGGAALLTKVSAENPSPNGTHKFTADQISRLAVRTLGVSSSIALMHAINTSNGAAKLNIQRFDRKTGEAWENKATGETGTYTKDWTEFRNHEVNLGQAVSMQILSDVMKSAVEHAPIVASSGSRSNISNVSAAPIQELGLKPDADVAAVATQNVALEPTEEQP